MLNKQRCSADAAGPNSQRKDPPGKNANPVKKTDGMDISEFKPVVRKPYWQGDGEQKSWS